MTFHVNNTNITLNANFNVRVFFKISFVRGIIYLAASTPTKFFCLKIRIKDRAFYPVRPIRRHQKMSIKVRNQDEREFKFFAVQTEWRNVGVLERAQPLLYWYIDID